MFKNKEVLYELIKKNLNDAELRFLITSTLKSFGDYVKIVNSQDVFTSFEKYGLDPKDYQRRVQELDTQRTRIHDSIISGISVINRICLANNLPKFYLGNEVDRVAVGDFVMEVVTDSFASRNK